MAYGQEDIVEPSPKYHHYVLAILSFVAAGVFYSSLGFIKKFRMYLGGQKASFDFHKMGKSVLVGTILGAGAFVYSLYMGDTIAIHTPHEFFTQVSLNSVAILMIDKILLGRANPQVPIQPLGGETLYAEDEEELPPGK